VANRLGLGAALDYALALGVDAIWARVHALAANLRRKLAELPGLALRDEGVERCGIVTFTIDGVDVYELAARLRTEGINISVSTIDFARFDFEARGLEAVARASVHYYNTEEELTRFVDALRTGVSKRGQTPRW
jgi:selenocysteine lyase/cysteine desulfurase